ncbi:MAG: hypothetical protein K1Y36_26585 [Blastocatellia bacterium]|nr:hypothetical protein [Blastocatellia bacterium]
MQTPLITPEFARQIEMSEAAAWLDMYEAIPPAFAKQFRLQAKQIGELVMLQCGAIPFIHFNCVMGVGLVEPLTEAVLDDLLDTYRTDAVNTCFFHHIPHCQPAEMPFWLAARGLKFQSSWDRIFRDGQPLPADLPSIKPGLAVAEITPETGSLWADFIVGVYHIPTKPWLEALVGRPGWHHYVLRREEEIVAARSMYLGPGGTAWFGIDAPVPGLMGPTFDLDFELCRRMVADSLNRGTRLFIADIEAPDPEQQTPAYGYFADLGFQLAYLRKNYSNG